MCVRPVTDSECLAPVDTVGKSQMQEKLDFSYVIGSCWPGEEVSQPPALHLLHPPPTSLGDFSSQSNGNKAWGERDRERE